MKKVIIITGASSDMGRDTAIRLAKEGLIVVCTITSHIYHKSQGEP